MAIMIKLRRYGPSHVLVDDVKVGEIFKMTLGGFGLRLRKIYWKRGVPNRVGGASTTSFPLRRQAVAAARLALES